MEEFKEVNVMKITGEYGLVRGLKSLIKNSLAEKHVRRILAEIRFVCGLSERGGGKYDEILARASAFLTEQAEERGAWTYEDVSRAERILAPAASEAKSYTFLCVAHAHMDMNFLWGYNETVGVVLDTLRTMLNIMDEYPDFRFSQSQASVYRIVEENDPEMLEEIKRRVREGRWEVTASSWVEADKNMPNGESQSRHILYTKDYLSKMFGIPGSTLDIDFEPDTFGHHANLPEILTQGGVRYYYYLRGRESESVLHRWAAPSGAEILAYKEPYWYTSLIDERISNYAVHLEKITGMKTFLKVYGVGDHGGGPTRRDVERIMDMDGWPVYPRFKFSFLRDFFKEADAVRETFPLFKGEINTVFDGCFTSQARIKAGNRTAEALMRDAEAFSALAAVNAGEPYPAEAYRSAWEKILFNQFHDILPGSGITETREYASAMYQQIGAQAEAKMKKAFVKISDSIDTSSFVGEPGNLADSIAEGGGVASMGPCCRGAGKDRAYVLFNSCAEDAVKTVELTLWDYEGDLDYIAFFDADNNPLPFQFTGKNEGYWRYHWFSRILVRASVPACGYALIYMKETEESRQEPVFGSHMTWQTPDTFVLENELLKVTLSPADGTARSVIHKPSGKEMADPARPFGLFRLIQEAAVKGSTFWDRGFTAWVAGRYKNVTPVNRNIEMKWTQNGPLRQTVMYETRFGTASTLYVWVSLDAGSAQLNYTVRCDWREFGGPDGVPSLSFFVPLNYSCGAYRYDMPFGVIDRPPADMDQPGLSFAAGLSAGEGLMLMSKTKYGYRCVDDSISLTLIRSSYDPDFIPEIGMHDMEFAVAVTGKDSKPADLIRRSEGYNHPFRAVSAARHGGGAPPSGGLIRLESGTAAVSSVKIADNDRRAVVARVCETDGKESAVALSAGFTPLRAELADCCERPAGTAAVEGSLVSFPIGPYQTRAVIIYF